MPAKGRLRQDNPRPAMQTATPINQTSIPKACVRQKGQYRYAKETPGSHPPNLGLERPHDPTAYASNGKVA
jgi:hypothetical protein